MSLAKKLVISGCIASFFAVMTAQALTISPARVELSGDPGTTISDTILLINEQNTDQTFYTSVENFEARGESGAPSFSTEKEGLSLWVKVPETVTLKKGQKMEVPFTITIPKGADAGGHFAAIFLSTVPPSTKAGEVAVGAKIGMLVLLRVSGDIKEGGGVLSFGLKDGGHFRTTLPIKFMYRFSNTGNDRANPVGSLSIRNAVGYKTEILNANPTDGNVLPNSTRRFDVTWGEENPLPESASFFDYVRYEARNFTFGPYFATLDVMFGTSGASKNTVFLFVFPWHLCIVLAVVLVILGIIFRALIRRYNRYIINQARIAMKE